MKPHNSKRSFKCVDCEGKVRYNSGKGTKFYHRGEYFILEEDVMMWICDKCGEAYLDEEECQEVDKVLEEMYETRKKNK